MTIKFKHFYLALLFLAFNTFAQETTKAPITGITDEMTVNADQNKSWRMGQSSYSAKPKNAWELGVHLGHFFIDGDVDRTIPGGYGLGLHLRKAIHYVFSVRADLFYGQAKGLEPQPYSHSSVGGVIGGSLNEPAYAPYGDRTKTDGIWFPSHKTNQFYAGLQGVINVGNLLFHKDRNKWNWYTTLGVALSSHNTKLDLLDAGGNPYTNLISKSGFNGTKFDTKAGRKDIKDALEGIYDGEYETDGPKKAGIFRIGDETNIHAMFTASMGISRKINKRFNIGIEHQVMATDNDYLDGIRFLNTVAFTQDVDLEHYTNVRLGINLGNFDKVTEPLYWLNPLEAQMNDIAALKQRPVFDLTDTDSDGVIDMLDQEMDTPAGAPVDTRGIALDSDGDGLADYKDKEPYSPAGVPVNADGVADVKCCINMDDVNKAIDMKAGSFAKSDCGKWFLPMIHFDADRATVKPEYYGHIHHIAHVMKMCPDLCITVQGNTDVSSKNKYAEGLAYSRAENVANYLVSQYGVDRSRIKVMYGTESSPVFSNSSKESYMNRRVEVRVCAPTDSEMAKPEGAAIKTKSEGTSRGTKFIGNKNSGF